MILKTCQSTAIKDIFTESYLYNPFFVFYVENIERIQIFLTELCVPDFFWLLIIF